jgi:lysozyme family protein
VDIPKLTVEDAKGIYFRDYWQQCQCGSFPQPIGFVLFDSAVNQGPRKAIRMLQEALKVQQDGIIGTETLQAAQRADVEYITAQFVARRAFQYALHPSVIRYGQGWFNRLAECHQMALREK